MSETTPIDWKSWNELDETNHRASLADKTFWSKLSETQRQAFLNEADWQEIQRIPEAKQAKIDGLVALEAICQQLGLTEVQIFFLMSTRKLPAWLVGGTWKFDKRSVEQWVEGQGGLKEVKRDVEAQIARHRSQQAPSPKK